MRNGGFSAGSEEDRLLCARIRDAFDGAADYTRRFVGFIDPHGRAVAHKYISTLDTGDCEYAFFGGYEQAERIMLGVFPPYDAPDYAAFPVAALHMEWRFERLSHRDFLGAVLALGVRREKIGDIVVSGGEGGEGRGECTVFAEKAVAAHIAASLDRVGHAGVSCTIGDAAGTSLTREDNFKDIADTIPSPRLDCVVGVLTGLSRADSSELIKQGLVSLNYEQCCENSKEVDEGATVSIRGHGRFVIDRIGPRTRKGRLSFTARKYL